MRVAILSASLLAVALECAIVRRLLQRAIALPCFATFLVLDAVFSSVMAVVYLSGVDWLTSEYARIYAVGEPFILAVLVLAAIEALGPLPLRAASFGSLCVISTAAASQGGPAALRIAILGSVAGALTVSLTERWKPHAALMLGFILADVICSLAIMLGETHSIRPGAFLVFGQLVPLVGWTLWPDRLALAGPVRKQLQFPRMSGR